MQGFVKFLPISMLMSLVLTTACTPREDDQKNVVPDRDHASCYYSNLDGDSADFSAISANSRIENAAFAKPFNAKRLDGILSANAKETARYIDQTGVQLFIAPALGSGCDFQAITKAMPSPIQREWTRATEDDTEKLRTMGIYLPFNPNDSMKALTESAVMIVRKNSARWTLVHEFMHHLFSDYLNSVGKNVGLSKNRLNNLARRVAAYKTAPTEATELKKFIPLYKDYLKEIDNFVLSFPLEEIAIEDRLRDLYNSNRLQSVHSDEARSGSWYIRYSRDSFEKMIKVTEEELSTYIQKLQEINFYDEANELRPYLQVIQTRRDEITKIVDKDSYSADMGIVASSEIPNSFQPCSHLHQGEAILKDLENIFSHRH